MRLSMRAYKIVLWNLKSGKEVKKIWHLVHNHVPIQNWKFLVKKGFDFSNLNFTI